MSDIALTEQEFAQFQSLIYRLAGISMAPTKKSLVSGRLAKRLHYYQLSSYGDYFKLVTSGRSPDELQMAIDLLTTNETYFFREPKHFDFLREKILPSHSYGRPLRVWSAASSSGQEPYSLAMTLADGLNGKTWEMVASDISTRVLETARRGRYPIEQVEHIPKKYLTRFCLKGAGASEGAFMIEPSLRKQIQFMQVNLNETLPQIGEFDLVFLRNVMIYFDNDTKRQVVLRIMQKMRSGAYLLIGHSESLNGIVDELDVVQPSIYRKV